MEQIREVAATIGCANQMSLLYALKSGTRTVSELTDGTKQGQVAVSQRLRKLRERGLVSVAREGRFRWYKLTADGRKVLRAAAVVTPGL